MTMRGMILGTAAYMSPEQAKGKAVDRRADIWAFGCVLYEMITGRRAFGGDDVTDTITSVMRDTPDWSVLPAATPVAIRRLLERSLDKDPRRRTPHIAVARQTIEDAALPGERESDGGARVAARSAWPGYAWRIAMWVASVTVGVAGYLWLRPQPWPSDTMYRATLLVPENINPRAPSQRFAISPDGRYLAYAAASSAESRIRLWIRPLNAAEATQVPASDGAMAPFWSPDSRFVAFHADGELKKAPISGGPAVVICAASGTMPGAWNAADVIVFADGQTLSSVSARGGTAEPITTLEAGETHHDFPHFLPDGRHLIYAAYKGFESAGTFIASLGGGPRARLMDGSSNAQYASGHLLFVRETTLYAQGFDPSRRALTGEAVPIVETVLPNLTARPAGAFSVSQTGALVYQTALGLMGGGARLVWSTRGGQQTVVVDEPAVYRDIALSRDGRQAAIVPLDPRGRSDLWLLDLSRGVRTRFTFNSTTTSAVWSPDARSVIYSANPVNDLDMFRKSVDGGEERPVLEPRYAVRGGQSPYSWSPDGRVLLFDQFMGSNDVWALPLDGTGEPSPVAATPFSERWAQFSPDGRWIAYSSDESGRREVYLVRSGGAGGRQQVSVSGGNYPRWSRDGRELFFHSLDNKIVAARIAAAGDRIEVGALTPLFDARAPDGFARFFYDVAPDGRFLLSVPPPTSSVGQVNLLVNWPRIVASR
jgi:Tol biopolymer transport system component